MCRVIPPASLSVTLVFLIEREDADVLGGHCLHEGQFPPVDAHQGARQVRGPVNGQERLLLLGRQLDQRRRQIDQPLRVVGNLIRLHLDVAHADLARGPAVDPPPGAMMGRVGAHRVLVGAVRPPRGSRLPSDRNITC